jgi:hypothetical protein
MQRIHKMACAIGFSAMTLVSCGGSDSNTGGAAGTASNSTAAPTETTGGAAATDPAGTIGSLPGVNKECTDFYGKYLAAMGSAGTGTANGISSMFAKMKAVLPDDLKDDADTLIAAWSKYEAVLAKYGNDMSKAMTDPEALAAIQAIGNKDVSAASDNISAYFTATCPSG